MCNCFLFSSFKSYILRKCRLFAKLLVNIRTSTRNCTSHWTRPFSPPSTKTSSFSCSTSFCCPRKKRRYSLNRIGCALIFYLTFLLTSHLSSNLVAAFVKKLSRMSLTCPPGDARFMILFIYNLLIRHKNCKILINNTKALDCISGNHLGSIIID